MLHPTVFNTAQICHQLGIADAVLSPGSRNAPLTLSFARHAAIHKWIIPDERSAGFIALGIAQEKKTPVALCCTSGTALLNYAPAVAEAYYREMPLIVISADRPPELIDQRDGQTIRQHEALKNHVKASYQLPIIHTQKDAQAYRHQLIEAIRLSEAPPKGPVHINIPFAEPFYPTSDQKLEFVPILLPQAEKKANQKLPSLAISNYKKILILIGQQDSNPDLNQILETIADKLPVIRSPLNNLSIGISHVDAFIGDQEELRPDLLITSGLSVLSKKLKTFLRKHKPAKHLHFDPSGVYVDTYQTKPVVIQCTLQTFLQSAAFDQADTSFLEQWQSFEARSKNALQSFSTKASFSEAKAAKLILDAVPSGSTLHLSNSMPVRYADLFGIKNDTRCLCNRGTSGIDGCTSSAVGTSLVSKNLNVLITGDLAFFYDRNAFFHQYALPNLRIIVLNNQGGGIFRLIEGPSHLPELEEYFETRHNRSAEYLCTENNMDYIRAMDKPSLRDGLEKLFMPASRPGVLEVFTDPTINQKEYKKLKDTIYEYLYH